ncbi:MAG: LysM peptidoglycan-binding domain-containing protein [Anaerolineae bacterium]
MKKIHYPLLVLAFIVAILFPMSASAAGPQWVTVNWGDTLSAIASRNGTTVNALMQTNRLPNPNFVYAGQRLLIPTSSAPASAPASAGVPSAANSAFYTVHAGDTLYSIASRYGISTAAIAQTNGIWNYDFIYTGQVLKIPGASAPSNPAQPTLFPPAAQATPAPAVNAPVGGKWIDVNISKQTITAFDGSTALKTVLVSTGIAVHPTVVGRFAIYSKYAAYNMSGGTPGVDYYYLPNVPWTMYFYSGYAIHGTYWHHNFGHPMSHGCVNLTIADAKWFYDWAPIGTPVITHY